MSRGFVNEDDQEDIPLVPPRADLPPGVTNYVTQVGINELLQEKKNLLSEIENLDPSNEKEKRIATNHIHAKLQLLNNRISSAKIINLSQQPKDEIRFGAWVSLLEKGQKKPQRYQIVGVDEANISKGKISFISPLARILINKKVGENASLKLADRDRIFEIKEIEY